MIAATGCYGVCQIINGSLIIVVLGKIICCSLVCNLVFLMAFYKSREFNKLKDIVKRIIAIIGNKLGA